MRAIELPKSEVSALALGNEILAHEDSDSLAHISSASTSQFSLLDGFISSSSSSYNRCSDVSEYDSSTTFTRTKAKVQSCRANMTKRSRHFRESSGEWVIM